MFDVLVYFDGVYDNTITIITPALIPIGGTFTYNYANIACGLCDVKIVMPLATPNCTCRASEDSIWTGVPLSASIEFLLKARLNAQKHAEITWNIAPNDLESMVLERSNDVGEFLPIATIQPENGKINYQYIDKTVDEGRYYYRLRLYWKQGYSTRSHLVWVDLPMQDVELRVYPNPFERDMRLKFSKALKGDVLIQITDLAGKELWAYEEPIDGQEMIARTRSLPAGTYLLRVQQGSRVWERKVVKQ
ncbi:MAG: T9SS C-terminal target domain-containing protein [Bacteroidetes bacterium]|nr:MAG: T9SS C-terminal target domain-containing protein [Bacteroidota bacterium]